MSVERVDGRAVGQRIGQQILELVDGVDVVRAVRIGEVLGLGVRLIVRKDDDRRGGTNAGRDRAPSRHGRPSPARIVMNTKWRPPKSREKQHPIARGSRRFGVVFGRGRRHHPVVDLDQRGLVDQRPHRLVEADARSRPRGCRGRCRAAPASGRGGLHGQPVDVVRAELRPRRRGALNRRPAPSLPRDWRVAALDHEVERPEPVDGRRPSRR